MFVFVLFVHLFSQFVIPTQYRSCSAEYKFEIVNFNCLYAYLFLQFVITTHYRSYGAEYKLEIVKSEVELDSYMYETDETRIVRNVNYWSFQTPFILSASRM